MFPYIHTEYFLIGPIKIYFWGFFVSLGFLISIIYLIKKYPNEKEVFVDIGLYGLLGSLLGARVFYTIFYAGDFVYALKHFFNIWQGGLSSFGGFFGATVAIFIYIKRKKLDFYEVAQKVAFILPLGLAIGRLGCFFINDHPGIKTSLDFLAVAYPDGVRFDLGLLLVLLNLIIFISFLKIRGRFFEYFMLFYGIGRFTLDFLRIDEPVFAGLIPSQYGSILLIVFSLYLLKKLNKKV